MYEPQVQLVKSSLARRYGKPSDPRSAWVHMSDAQRDDALRAEVLSILLMQADPKYAPAIEAAQAILGGLR